VLRLRPLGPGELLDDVFRVDRRHFWLPVAIALRVALPGLLLQFASGSASQFGFVLSVLGDLNNAGTIVIREWAALRLDDLDAAPNDPGRNPTAARPALRLEPRLPLRQGVRPARAGPVARAPRPAGP
jgi:hypothetical protein